jgi:hypothetical protein
MYAVLSTMVPSQATAQKLMSRAWTLLQFGIKNKKFQIYASLLISLKIAGYSMRKHRNPISKVIRTVDYLVVNALMAIPRIPISFFKVVTYGLTAKAQFLAVAKSGASKATAIGAFNLCLLYVQH